MFDLKELKEFLIKASSKTYASDNSAEAKEKDGSTTYEYKDGPWKYHDNFFGGEPFGGREVIFYEDKPVWMMTYYGGTYGKNKNLPKLYNFLKQALSNNNPEDEVPCRGPQKFIDGDMKYFSNVNGSLKSFTGEEFILKDGNEIYCAVYNGGLVDSH